MRPSTDGLTLDEFQGLYETHQAYVRKCLYWMISSESIDDVVQDCFVKVWKSYSGFKKDANIKTWIYRIAMNTAYDHLRKEKKHDTLELVTEPESGDSFENKSHASEILRKAVGRLPEKMRSVFVLFYIEELSLEEVSEALKIPVGTVKSRLANGRDHVKEYCKRNGVSYE